jgi:glutaredoxin
MMKKPIVFFVTLFVGIIFAGATIAEIYKWVDENGIIHLSDSPPQEIVSTGKVELVPTIESDPQIIQQTEKQTRKARSNTYTVSPVPQITKRHKTPKVELYTTAWCVYCRKARDFFRSRGIAFIEYDIEKDENAARRKNQLTDRRGVPFAVINGKRIHGFDQGAYIRALKGYL